VGVTVLSVVKALVHILRDFFSLGASFGLNVFKHHYRAQI
jgi:multisubunit Na+/H+ antiporter MnhG subunit